ncbi:hypothetical protein BGX31_010458 [Mortierella sp. GBA43]|nr:hypothetical protein BGX31_010458 [Mortierella sp. GBA43]
MAERIQKKLVGLEAVIEKLEDKADVMSMDDWKRAQTAELDKYMDMRKKELWDKAELLSSRSKEFQKEEAARKLRLYQNQFETDMAQYRKTQEEKKHELWKIAESELLDPSSSSSRERRGSRSNLVGSSPIPSSSSTSSLVQDGPRIHYPEMDLLTPVPAAVLIAQEEDERREQEDLDRFLGPASDNDSKEDAEDSEEDEDDDDEEEEDEDDEDEESSEDDLDPIAMARKAQSAAAAAKRSSTGGTISAFSALANHPSTTSLTKQ